MEFNPGDRVYHGGKHGYATVIRQLTEETVLIEFDEPIGVTYSETERRRGWRADCSFLELVEEATVDTPIDITNLI